MRCVFHIAWREFTENVKTKGFWIGILLLPLCLLLAINVPIALEKKGVSTRHFVLVDASSEFESVISSSLASSHHHRVVEALSEYATQHLKPAPGRDALLVKTSALRSLSPAQFADQGGVNGFLDQLRADLRTNAPPFDPPTPRFSRASLPPGITAGTNLDVIAQELKPYLNGSRTIMANGKPQRLFAAVLIPPGLSQAASGKASPAVGDTPQRPAVRYWCENLVDTALRDVIERAINGEIRRKEYIARKLDLSAIRQVEALSAPVLSFNPKKGEGKETVSLADHVRQVAPSVFVYILWVAIFVVAQMLLNSTIDEKSNRIVEVLLSSVTPSELMAGKLLGTAAVGMSMVTMWITCLISVLWWKAGTGIPHGQVAEVAAAAITVAKTSALLPAFAVYFVLGYLLYGALFLALGSTCNTIKETQNFMGVIMMILMVPLMTMMFIPRDPNGTVATVLSWIPLYTPFVMMNRITASPPWFELVGTTLLLAGFTVLVVWLSGRIFRVGILRTGQPPRLRELIRWLQG